MKGCTLSSNYGVGTALFNREGRAILKDCEIKENGGDASVLTTGRSYLQLDNCSIHDNYGRCFGGGIALMFVMWPSMEALSSIILLSMVEESMSRENLLLLTRLQSMIIQQPLVVVVAYATM